MEQRVGEKVDDRVGERVGERGESGGERVGERGDDLEIVFQFGPSDRPPNQLKLKTNRIALLVYKFHRHDAFMRALSISLSVWA